MSETDEPNITTLAVQLLSAYVANNAVPCENLADLILSTRWALTKDLAAKEKVEAETEHPVPSVPDVEAPSDYIISLIDGKPYTSLMRHLAIHGLTPAQYRARYGLPESFPMVARAQAALPEKDDIPVTPEDNLPERTPDEPDLPATSGSMEKPLPEQSVAQENARKSDKKTHVPPSAKINRTAPKSSGKSTTDTPGKAIPPTRPAVEKSPVQKRKLSIVVPGQAITSAKADQPNPSRAKNAAAPKRRKAAPKS